MYHEECSRESSNFIKFLCDNLFFKSRGLEISHKLDIVLACRF
jgi:hypothetical protein